MVGVALRRVGRIVGVVLVVGDVCIVVVVVLVVGAVWVVVVLVNVVGTVGREKRFYMSIFLFINKRWNDNCSK